MHLSSQEAASVVLGFPSKDALAKISWPTFVISPRKVHSSSQLIRSVMLGFPAKVSWPNNASLPREVSSQPIPSEVSDFPNAVVFSRHWGGGVTPPAIYVPDITSSILTFPLFRSTVVADFQPFSLKK